MTNEQLQQLKGMSLIERTKKYTPMVLKRIITKEQYEWIMSVGVPTERPPDAPQGDLSPSTHHSDKIVGKSQKERLYSLLRDGAWHDTVEILQKVYGGEKAGIARIGARIHDLKQDGYHIEGRDKTKTIYEYRLWQKN